VRAALGSALFFVLGPGLEAGVGPYLLTGFSRGDDVLAGPVAVAAGVVLVAAGLAVLVATFVRFARDGAGTPSPLAPAARLVVRGPYRHVRNPMYVATAAVIAGEGLVLAQPVLLVAAAVYVGVFVVWTRRAEEPLLQARFGAAYEAYRRAVPGGLPRRRPWEPPG
jgi:protein-S-isoprenylcysteine O-methyltransferase Ste14